MYKYRSGFEREFAKRLKKLKIPFKYEFKKFPWKKRQTINKVLREAHGIPEDHNLCTYHLYTVDFTFEQIGLHLELKGRFKSSDRTKIINVIEQHPDADIRMVFQRNNKIHPGSRTTYADWCKKRNIPYCVGKVPMSWLTGEE